MMPARNPGAIKRSNWRRWSKGSRPRWMREPGTRSALNIVRDACRRSIAEFVKLWLLQEDHRRTGRLTPIVVLFPDEVQPGSDVAVGEAVGQPTLTFH